MHALLSGHLFLGLSIFLIPYIQNLFRSYCYTPFPQGPSNPLRTYFFLLKLYIPRMFFVTTLLRRCLPDISKTDIKNLTSAARICIQICIRICIQYPSVTAVKAAWHCHHFVKKHLFRVFFNFLLIIARVSLAFLLFYFLTFCRCLCSLLLILTGSFLSHFFQSVSSLYSRREKQGHNTIYFIVVTGRVLFSKVRLIASLM